MLHQTEASENYRMNFTLNQTFQHFDTDINLIDNYVMSSKELIQQITSNRNKQRTVDYVFLCTAFI